MVRGNSNSIKQGRRRVPDYALHQYLTNMLSSLFIYYDDYTFRQNILLGHIQFYFLKQIDKSVINSPIIRHPLFNYCMHGYRNC